MTIAMPDHAAAMPAAPVCSAPMISIAEAAALGWFPPDWSSPEAERRRAKKEARAAAVASGVSQRALPVGVSAAAIQENDPPTLGVVADTAEWSGHSRVQNRAAPSIAPSSARRRAVALFGFGPGVRGGLSLAVARGALQAAPAARLGCQHGRRLRHHPGSTKRLNSHTMLVAVKVNQPWRDDE